MTALDPPVSPLRDGDPQEPAEMLLRDLRAAPTGSRRVRRSGGSSRIRPERAPADGEGAAGGPTLARQFTHPLALLLWAGRRARARRRDPPLGDRDRRGDRAQRPLRVRPGAAGRARGRGARAPTCPSRRAVRRDGRRASVDAASSFPGDVLVLAGGRPDLGRRPALSRARSRSTCRPLTGESQPVFRVGRARRAERASLLEARDLVFSGTACVGGEAEALVFATGMRTELGRIAALSQRVEPRTARCRAQVNGASPG